MPDPQPQQGRGLGATLKSKWGPLPVWGWLLLVTILALGYYLWSRRSGAGQTTAQMAGQPGVVVINQDEPGLPSSPVPPKEPKEDKDKDDKKKKGKGGDEPEDKESGEQEQDERARSHRHGGHRRHRRGMSAPSPVPLGGPSPEPLVPITGPQVKAPRGHRRASVNIGNLFPVVTPQYGRTGGQQGGRAGQGPV